MNTEADKAGGASECWLQLGAQILCLRKAAKEMGFEHTTVTVRGNAPCDNLHPTNCNNGHMSDTVLERIFEKPPFLILPACQHVGYDRIYSSGAVLFLLKQQADFIDNNIFFKTINIKLKKRYKYEMSGNSTILWFYFHFNLLTVASLM